jgi:cyanate permease
MSVLGILITFCLAFCAYFLPALVARARDHRNASAIVVLNFFLGWTGLGWIVALIWAYTNDKAPAMARPSMAPGG